MKKKNQLVDDFAEKFDPQMLIEAVLTQAPDFPWLPAALISCGRGEWKSAAYVRYVSAEAANQPGEEWQFEASVVINHRELGMTVIDVLAGHRIGGIEFVDRI